jgi:hypothetical protein
VKRPSGSIGQLWILTPQCWYGEVVLASDGQSFWEADHILEVAANGSDSLRNIQTLCMVCHKAKTAEFIKRHRSAGLIYPCGVHCENWDHATEILELLEKRYDAMYYVGGGSFFTVNIAPGLRSDYMARAHTVVEGHLKAMRQIVMLYHESAASEVSNLAH